MANRRSMSSAELVSSFLKDIERYIDYLQRWEETDTSGKKSAERLRSRLLGRQSSIVRLLGNVRYSVFGVTRSAWDGLQQFDPFFAGSALTALSMLRDAVVVKLGELETPEEANPLSSISGQTPLGVFDAIELDSTVVGVSRELFANGHYEQASFEAYKLVDNEVKSKAGIPEMDGRALMAHVFSEERPLLRLNALASRSNRDEQEGFKLIFMGAMQGIRNPKAHDHVAGTSASRALKYLALASLLIERAGEAQAP